MAFLGRAFRWWNRMLDERPYVTQILTNGPLWTSADIVCQKFVVRNRRYVIPIFLCIQSELKDLVDEITSFIYFASFYIAFQRFIADLWKPKFL
jgi:hypothetical protein